MNYFKKTKNILGLSIQLAKTSFKLKNEGSFLGIFWYLLEPLFMFIIFLFVKNIVGNDIPNYSLYLFLGLIMFNFFRKTTTEAIKAITNNAGIITSFKLNQEVFVLATIIKSSLSHLFEIIVFLFFLIYFSVSFLNILIYPFIFFIFFIFVLGISFFAATLGVFINDFNNLWGVFTRLLWFATPIFYSSKLITKINLPFDFNFYNPVYYYITLARNLVIYNKLPELSIIYGSIIFAIISFLAGLFIFEKYKNKFAEII